MIIIAFAENTSKILPRILCRHYRHCAPIICSGKDLIMYQFIRRNHITKIHLCPRDITILRLYGWKFIYISPTTPVNLDCVSAYSCVDLTKQALNIKSVFIQTPHTLYRHITKK